MTLELQPPKDYSVVTFVTNQTTLRKGLPIIVSLVKFVTLDLQTPKDYSIVTFVTNRTSGNNPFSIGLAL